MNYEKVSWRMENRKKIANLAFVNFNFRMNFNDKTFANDDE